MHEDDEHPDHVHLTDADRGRMQEVEGLETFSIRSVGIDVGSATSHLVFSRLTLRRRGADLSTRFEVTERAILHRSPIALTPYASPTRIDTEGLRRFFADSYQRAGIRPQDVDTGAVVITGEALNKENARPIAELFAQESGRFICASAGPNHEALLAAHGSGAVDVSRDERATVLNVDTGGGTTKLAVVREGRVEGTAAFSVGARLLAFDSGGRVTRVEPPARTLLRELSDSCVEAGDTLAPDVRLRLAELMASVLFEFLAGHPRTRLARDLLVTPPLEGYRGLDEVDALVFSGGVAEYLYRRHHECHGDLGPELAGAIHRRLQEAALQPRVRVPRQGVRATVVGAGEYTVQASGVTSHVSSPAVLPAAGLKVVRAVVGGPRPVRLSLRAALRALDLDALQPGLALALALDRVPDYGLLREMAEGICSMTAGRSAHWPLFLLVDVDVAKALGAIVKEEAGWPGEVVALDGVEVGDLDYVDIGRPLGASESLPVTVKSLMFPAEEHAHGQR